MPPEAFPLPEITGQKVVRPQWRAPKLDVLPLQATANGGSNEPLDGDDWPQS